MTDEPTRYEITTVADILALSPEQRVRCVADMAGWVNFINSLEVIYGESLQQSPIMTWLDGNTLAGTKSGTKVVINLGQEP